MFEKGTKVTLKTTLVRKKYYGILPYFIDLEYWQGKVMTIQKSYIKEEHRLYIVNENNYTWAEEMLMNNFVKERNEALSSLDENKINAYLKKYEVPIPSDKYVYWIAINKSIEAITSISDAEKEIISEKIKKKLEECIHG